MAQSIKCLLQRPERSLQISHLQKRSKKRISEPQGTEDTKETRPSIATRESACELTETEVAYTGL